MFFDLSAAGEIWSGVTTTQTGLYSRLGRLLQRSSFQELLFVNCCYPSIYVRFCSKTHQMVPFFPFEASAGAQ